MSKNCEYFDSLSPVQQLKVDIMTNGVKITERAYRELTSGGGVITLGEFVTTNGIGLNVDGGTYVNSPFGYLGKSSADSGTRLEFGGDAGYFLEGPNGEFKVKPIPVPRYAYENNSKGVPYIFYAVTHTDRVRISPIAGCSFRCKFCDLPYSYRYTVKGIPDILEATKAAIEDPLLPPRHALISGGTPVPRDYDYLDDVYSSVIRHVSIPVDLMLVPRKDLSHIDKLFSMGVNMVYYNLEIYDQSLAKEYMIHKSMVSREHYFKCIERAVDVFGKNRVQSLIIVGLEPLHSTLKGVEELARRGCIPILSPFRPSPETPMKSFPTPTIEDLAQIYIESLDVVKRYDTKLGPRCIPCHHNTLTFPDGSDFYFYY